MAPAPLPFVIRASFVLSGMFGFNFDGLKTRDGQPVIVNAAVPLNFSVPVTIVDTVPIRLTGPSSPSQSPSLPPLLIPLKPAFPSHIPDRSNNQKCFGKCETTGSSGGNGGGIGTNTTTSPSSPDQNSVEPSRKPCGPGYCSYDEMCVSWVKQRKSRRDSPRMVHECFPNDGNHYTKMSPSGDRLCEDGKTHSIVQEGRNCLKENPPCELVWKYTCIDENDSPHSCSLKKCARSVCVEMIHCGLEPPCYTEAICVPELYPHDYKPE